MGLYTKIKHHVTCDRTGCRHAETANITLTDMKFAPDPENYFTPSGWMFHEGRWLCPTHAERQQQIMDYEREKANPPTDDDDAPNDGDSLETDMT